MKKAARDPIFAGMSRAFVNEDNFVDDLPDRPVSQHPNLVPEYRFPFPAYAILYLGLFSYNLLQKIARTMCFDL